MVEILAKAIFLPTLSMRWLKIKIRMLEQGIYTQKALAEKLGVNPSTITRLLKGERKSRRLEKQIAEILGMAPNENKSDEEKTKKDTLGRPRC
jgi:transcriptional regulator with XRE-family HTH domain